MQIIVGLGNPGRQYAANRHNVGFVAVEAIHRRHAFGPWRRRFHAEVSEGTLGGVKVLLVKPQTYMNESGRSVGEIVTFYKAAPGDVVVIHDEIDLAPGKVRMKAGGGTAGHNGLRSIGAAIGDGFRRLRVGVGHPGVKELVHAHVLHDFAKADREWLEPLIEAIAEHAPLLAEGKDQTFANRLHPPEPRAEKPKKAKEKEPPAESKSEPSGAPEGALARGLRRLFGKGG